MRMGSFSRMVLVKQPVANFCSLKRAERKLSLLCSIPSPKTFHSLQKVIGYVKIGVECKEKKILIPSGSVIQTYNGITVQCQLLSDLMTTEGRI
jgi:hypothetical protein